ncbi:MAG: MFS transporter [Candidatus Hydrogenedentes bacterium]|nr:MFS transporter [Candidatus Hydrogenedentota bacterium]
MNTATRAFPPFFATQFLGAFNDNYFKNALVMLITFQAAGLWGLGSAQLIALTGGIFIAPFFLFSPMAGKLADRYDKVRLIRIIKAAEVMIMAIGAAGFLLGSLPVLLVALFLMGAQSAFFGPIKYGYLPEILPREDLLKGNARIEIATFVAILAGTILGGLAMSHARLQLIFVPVGIIGLALLGCVAAWRIPRPLHSAVVDSAGVSLWQVFRQDVLASRAVRNAMLGSSWFWFLGATILSLFPVAGKSLIGGDEALITACLTLFSLGIGLGSFVCERLSRGRTELAIVPLGAAGLLIFLIDFAWLCMGLGHTPYTTLRAFLLSAEGLHFSCSLMGMSACAGAFVVPLQTLLQERSREGVRSRVIALANMMSALFMVVSAVALMAAHGLGFSIPQIVLALAVGHLAVCVYTFATVPEFVLRFLCWAVARVLYRIRIEGSERVPSEGAAVLVSNHVTAVDWLLIAASTHRIPRFVMHHSFNDLPVAKYLFRFAGVIPIAGRSESQAVFDRAFVRIEAALKAGEVVCIFPEGQLTRDGHLGPFKAGIERIIATTPVPVVPIALVGFWDSFFSRSRGQWMRGNPLRKLRAETAVRIGTPVSPESVNRHVLQEQVAELLAWPAESAA